MSWNRDWSSSSWASSFWDKNASSAWNNRDWQRGPNNRSGSSPPSQSSVPGGTVSIPSSFTPDWECYDIDSNSLSNKKFFRNIQSTPWSTKSGLAGKVVKSISEAVFEPASSHQTGSYRSGCSGGQYAWPGSSRQA